MKKIIMFVMVLAISAPSLADDLNPPDWACGPGTVYGIWNFPAKWSGGGGTWEYFPFGDYPEEGKMEPHATHPDPDEFDETLDTEPAAHKHMMVPYVEQAPTWKATYEGRQGVLVGPHGWSLHSYSFRGSGKLLIRLQITWYGTGSIVELWMESLGNVMDPDEVKIVLDDGWNHSTFDFVYEPPQNPAWEGIYFRTSGTYAIDQIVMDIISYTGVLPPDGGRGVEPAPILIDPNVMMVYETDETEGDFGVSMRIPMEPETSVTVTIDPNSDDITLIGSASNGTITMIFDANNWDVPQTVVFKAIDDEIAEPPELLELVRIKLSSIYSEPLQDPNWAGEALAKVRVMDNDQANIMFRVTPPRGGPRVPVIGPVQLWEQFGGAQGTLVRWRKIGIQLQVQPKNTADPCLPCSVKLHAEVTTESDNLPLTDPNLVLTDKPHFILPFQEADDPNCFTFTSNTSTSGLGKDCPGHDPANKTTCWNVDQDVIIWGSDDAVLQAEEAEQEGDQNYQAVLSVWVIDDGGDERYAEFTEQKPKKAQFSIEDNECGAFGILKGDVGNPNAFTDPNDRDSVGNPLPDFYLNIFDVIEVATQWLDCSNLQDPSCESVD